MAAVRARRNRQPAQRTPEIVRLFVESAAAAGPLSLVEVSQPLDAGTGRGNVAATNGLIFGVAMATFTYGFTSLTGLPPELATGWTMLTGGLTTAAGMIAWSVGQGSQEVTYHAEFVAPTSQPPEQPAGNTRFVRPDPEGAAQMIALPGDWTVERLQQFARRLIDNGYDFTVRSWTPDFCSYEQLKALLAWLESCGVVSVADGRGRREIAGARAKRVIEQWAAGRIEAL